LLCGLFQSKQGLPVGGRLMLAYPVFTHTH